MNEMSDKPTSLMKRRLNGVILLLILIAAAYAAISMGKVSLKEAGMYQEMANAQQLRSKIINASRGAIYDANMQVLAKNATVYNIYVDPVMMKNYLAGTSGTVEAEKLQTLDQIADKLADLLDMDAADIKEKCQKDNRYQDIKKNVSNTVADQISAYCTEHEIDAIGCTPASKRFYPQNELAASVIGHLNYDGQGVYGLESYYNDFLSGVNGRILTLKDKDGNDIPYQYKQNYDAQDGDSLVLNLDIKIQYYLEKALVEGVAKNLPTCRACGIVMNAKTGAIYAMATVPGYDLNSPATVYDPATAAQLAGITDADEKSKQTSVAWATQWKNKAISELYYPGSVFKVITGSSALDEKAINLTETFSGATSITVNGVPYNNWATRDLGPQTFQTAMTNSVNPAFIQIGQKLGIEKFFKYFKAYGFTEKTGIDLPAESNSLTVDSDMTIIDLASSSFGQTNKITPIQMITAYAAAVNGGYLMTPQVVDKIVDGNGNVVKDFSPVVRRQVISAETSATMRTILETVVNTSPGGNAYIQGYRIGGKSGTSQKMDVNKNWYVASYCAFAPADDPEIICLVMVDDPKGPDYYGSKVAAPIVAQTLKDVLPYMGYFPEYTAEQLKEIEASVTNVQYLSVDNAKKTLEGLGLKTEILGSGDTVIKQVPMSGSVQRGSTVLLYTEKNMDEETAVVPNLYGMTLDQAKTALENAGLSLSAQGSAVHEAGSVAGADQSVAANAEVARGSIVTVTFYAASVSSQ
ncbi:MAG: penicillin-binding transpeptidase domain-containing protein [Oscillospiraceae bacterium]